MAYVADFGFLDAEREERSAEAEAVAVFSKQGLDPGVFHLAAVRDVSFGEGVTLPSNWPRASQEEPLQPSAFSAVVSLLLSFSLSLSVCLCLCSLPDSRRASFLPSPPFRGPARSAEVLQLRRSSTARRRRPSPPRRERRLWPSFTKYFIASPVASSAKRAPCLSAGRCESLARRVRGVFSFREELSWPLIAAPRWGHSSAARPSTKLSRFLQSFWVRCLALAKWASSPKPESRAETQASGCSQERWLAALRTVLTGNVISQSSADSTSYGTK